MKRTLYLLICLSVLAWTMQSCSDDNKAETPPTSDPEISFPAGSETQPVFATEGGTSTLTFTASEAWTASVGEANTRAIDWLTVSPTSGQAGTATLTITTDSYYGDWEQNPELTDRLDDATGYTIDFDDLHDGSVSLTEISGEDTVLLLIPGIDYGMAFQK